MAVHQVAKLARLGTPGPGQPAWAALMASKRRKTLVVCTPATTPSTQPLSRTRHNRWRAQCAEKAPAGFGGRLRGKGRTPITGDPGPRRAAHPVAPGTQPPWRRTATATVTATLLLIGVTVATVPDLVPGLMAPGGPIYDASTVEMSQ